MLKHVHIHNVFIYTVYFDTTYTRQIYVLCTHDIFIRTPGFDFGAWKNHEDILKEQRRAALEKQSLIFSTTSSVTMNEI